MIIRWLKRLLGIDVLEFRCRKDRERLNNLEKPKSYMGVDVGFRNPTTIVVMQKNTNGLSDKVDVYQFHPGTEFAEINHHVLEIARRYGVEKNRLLIDQPTLSASVKRRL